MLDSMDYVTPDALDAGLDHIRRSPSQTGTLEQLVRRPGENERDVLVEGVLDREDGLIGDDWRVRGSTKTADGSAHPDKQLTVMNARLAALVAGAPDRWGLAGDQLYVDLDISEESLPPGTRLAIGATAVIEVTAEPHLGCSKFSARFGRDALRFVNSPTGRALRLRGLNAKVVKPGPVRVGDVVRRLP